MFHSMADAIVWTWFQAKLGDEVAVSGIRDQLRELLAECYANDSLIALRDPVLLQEAFDTLVALFVQVRLVTNITKTK